MNQVSKNSLIQTLPNLSILAATGIIAFAVAAPANAVEPIGDDAGLFVIGTASASYNDNIYLNHAGAKSDEIFDFSPGLSLEFGKNNALTKGKLAVWEDWQIFSTGSGLNNNFTNGVFSGSYSDPMTKIDFDAEFHQTDQAQRDINNVNFLVNRDLEHVAATGELQMSDKSSVASGIIFDNTDFKRVGYTDWKWTEIPVNYYFKYDPKLDLSAGFRFKDNVLGAGGIDSRDFYYNIGARGEFTPTLTGEIDVGYNQQQMENGIEYNGLGADSNFTYAYSQKTNLLLGANDDFGYDAVGGAYRLLSPYLGFNAALDDQWSINGRVSYSRYEYLTGGRKDDFYGIQAGLTYIVNVNFSVSGSYQYNENNSTLTVASFKGNIFTISGSIHY